MLYNCCTSDLGFKLFHGCGNDSRHSFDVWVKGGPWNTTVIIRWSAVQDLPDGSPYNNHGVHIIRMRWGKVFDIDANEDSQLVAASLQIWAEYGVNEALADPILS